MKIILTAMIAVVALLSGCNSEAGTGKANQSNSLGQGNVASQVYFDSFGTIPKVGNNSNYMVRLHNDSNNNYKIISALLSPVTKGVNSSKASLEQNNCVELAAQSHCGFILNYPANNTTSYILTAEVENSSHQRQTIKTALLAGNANSTKNGISYSLLTDVASHDGNYHIGAPVYLTDDFKQITASEGILYCRSGYHRGSSCTYYKDGHITKDQLLINKLTATKSDQTNVEVSLRSHIRATGFSHLLMSVPEDIELDNENQVLRSAITIFNLGNQAANGFSLDTDELHAGVTLDDNTCGGQIAGYATCNIILKIQSDRNGANILKASYQDSSNQAAKELAYQFIHTVNINQPQLIWATSGDNFENTVLNEEREAEITLTAKNISFDKITISRDSNRDFEIVGNQSGLCQGNQMTVDPVTNDQSCTFSVKYKPQAVQMAARNFYFVASGTYVDSNGKTRTFAYPLALPYSAPFAVADALLINEGNEISLRTTTDEAKDFTIKLENKAKRGIELGTIVFDPLIEGTIIDSRDCVTISGESSCDLRVHYSPTIPVLSNSSLKINIAKFNGLSLTNNQVIANVDYAAAVPGNPLLERTLEAVSGNTVDATDSTKYWLKKGESIQLSYEIKNTSNGLAKAIVVTPPPAGWSVDSSDCANKTLFLDDSCRVIFSHNYSSLGPQAFKEQDVSIGYKYGKGDTNQDTINLGNKTKNIQVYKMPELITVTGDIGSKNGFIPGNSTRTLFTLQDGYPGMPKQGSIDVIINIPSKLVVNNECTGGIDYTGFCNIILNTDASLRNMQRQITFRSEDNITLDNDSLNLNFASFAAVSDDRAATFVPVSGHSECIEDTSTGLWWPKNPSTILGGAFRDRMSWESGLNAVNNINTSGGLCGKTDWHMANIMELKSLSNYKELNTAAWLNESGFESYNSDWYWSSTIRDTSKSLFFCINLGSNVISVNLGWFFNCSNENKNYVVFTRVNDANPPNPVWKTGRINTGDPDGSDGKIQSGESTPNPRFITITAQGESTECLEDSTTGLMWPKAPATLPNNHLKTVSFAGAEQSVNLINATTGWCGRKDWRLPSISEYNSLFNGSIGVFPASATTGTLYYFSPVLRSLGFDYGDVALNYLWSRSKFGQSQRYLFSMNSGDTAAFEETEGNENYSIVRGGI